MPILLTFFLVLKHLKPSHPQFFKLEHNLSVKFNGYQR
jgi:hypothetical protein